MNQTNNCDRPNRCLTKKKKRKKVELLILIFGLLWDGLMEANIYGGWASACSWPQSGVCSWVHGGTKGGGSADETGRWPGCWASKSWASWTASSAANPTGWCGGDGGDGDGGGDGAGSEESNRRHHRCCCCSRRRRHCRRRRPGHCRCSHRGSENSSRNRAIPAANGSTTGSCGSESWSEMMLHRLSAAINQTSQDESNKSIKVDYIQSVVWEDSWEIPNRTGLVN